MKAVKILIALCFLVVLISSSAFGAWTSVLSGATTPYSFIRGYVNSSTDTAYLIAGGWGLAGANPPNLQRSVNYGTSWTNITPTFPAPPAGGIRLTCMSANENVIAVAGVDNGPPANRYAYISTTNGSSWTSITGTVLPYTMNGIAASNSTTIVAAGGTVLSNGELKCWSGSDWTTSTITGVNLTGKIIYDVISIPGSTAKFIAVGNQSLLGVSTNGGISWTTSQIVAVNPSNYTLRSIAFRDANNGVVCGSSTLGAPILYRTDDGGATWRQQTISGFGGSPMGVCYATPTEIWIAANPGNVGVAKISKLTYIGNDNWTFTVSSDNLVSANSACAFDDDNIYVVCSDTGGNFVAGNLATPTITGIYQSKQAATTNGIARGMSNVDYIITGQNFRHGQGATTASTNNTGLTITPGSLNRIDDNNYELTLTAASNAPLGSFDVSLTILSNTITGIGVLAVKDPPVWTTIDPPSAVKDHLGTITAKGTGFPTSLANIAFTCDDPLIEFIAGSTTITDSTHASFKIRTVNASAGTKTFTISDLQTGLTSSIPWILYPQVTPPAPKSISFDGAVYSLLRSPQTISPVPLIKAVFTDTTPGWKTTSIFNAQIATLGSNGKIQGLQKADNVVLSDYNQGTGYYNTATVTYQVPDNGRFYTVTDIVGAYIQDDVGYPGWNEAKVLIGQGKPALTSPIYIGPNPVTKSTQSFDVQFSMLSDASGEIKFHTINGQPILKSPILVNAKAGRNRITINKSQFWEIPTGLAVVTFSGNGTNYGTGKVVFVNW